MSTKSAIVVENAAQAGRLLVVSKHPADLHELWEFVRSNAWECETVTSAWEALERAQMQANLSSCVGEKPISLVLLDVTDNADAIHGLRWLRYVRPDLPVLTMADDKELWQEAEALRLGAHASLTRPLDVAELQEAFLACMSTPKQPGFEAKQQPIFESIERFGEDSFFVCATPPMQKLRVHAESLAQVDAPVLIIGEQGSGKESTARLIHQLSVRSGFPFIKVDCSAFPSDLLEKELFGIEGGHCGQLALAEKGVIYLSDIAAMPTPLQARLLHVMQEKSFSRSPNRLNGAARVRVDARIMAATGPDAELAVIEGRLRRDLYYRLSAFSVQVPCLRQYKEGIPFLLGYWINRLAKQYSLPTRTLSPALLQACQAHPWRSNVSELRDFAKRYLVVGDEDLALWELKKHAGWQHHESHMDLRTRAEGSHSQSEGLKSLVRDIKGETERNAIVNALEETHWNRKAAARLLRISYRTLLYKIQSFGLTPPTLPMLLRQGAKREGRVE